MAASSRKTATASVIPPSAILSKVREVRRTPTMLPEAAFATVDSVQQLLRADENTRVGGLLGRDGLTEDTNDLLWSQSRGAAFSTVRTTWLQQIAAERVNEVTSDAAVDFRALRIDRRDGAMFRPGGGGAPYTEHALQQLLGLCTAGGTGFRSAASALGFGSPSVRSLLLMELQATAKRSPLDLVTVRTGFRVRQGVRPVGSPERERVIRAIMTARSSGIHFDDYALQEVLGAVAAPTAAAFIARSQLGTETRGWVQVSDRREKNGLECSVTFRNSETGQARLGFRASARIAALDAVVVAHRGVAVVDERDVELSTSRGASERNHTLPTIATSDLIAEYKLTNVRPGDKLTEDHRASIAAQRMTASFTTASAAAFELSAQWDIALKTFAPGTESMFAPAGKTNLDPKVAAQVILDLCEENGMMLGEDRAALGAILIDDARLMQLPHGSAAHVAAAFACIAARGTATKGTDASGKEVTTFEPLPWKEAQRLQEVAGRWVACGWDKKAHRDAMNGPSEE